MLRIYLSAIIMLMVRVCFAEKTKTFYPIVNPALQSFTQMRVDLRRDTVTFKQEKVIFGLNAKFNDFWTFNITVDLVGMNRPFFKPAVLTYKKDRWTVDSGILFTSEMDLAAGQFWANRFIDRVPADKWLLDPTADLGIRIVYRWNDYLATDFSVVSGNGYQHLREKYHPQPAFRFILSPVSGFKSGSYISLRKEDITETTFNCFAHFETKNKWKMTCEYHHKSNYRFQKGQQLNVASLYTTYYINPWLSLLGRYDTIWSKSDFINNGLSNVEDGKAFIGGIIIRCFPSVRLSVDYWNQYPKTQHIPKEDKIYFCLEFKY